MIADPLISIVMPSYNQAGYILEAIRSVQAQTCTDWELIVIDDGSTDDTRQVVAGCDEPRLRYIHQQNAERSRSRNRGIALARGRYVAFLDADDYWLPGYLEAQAQVLEADPGLGMSFTGVYDVSATGEIVRKRWWTGASTADRWGFYRLLLLGNRIPTPGCVVIRKTAFEQSGLFNPEFRAGEDWDMWLRLGVHARLHSIPEALMCYRRYHIVQAQRLHDRGIETSNPRLIQEIFDWPLPPELKAMRAQALAEVLWRTAWIRYATGNIEGGRERLAEAQAVFPERFHPPATEFIQALAYRMDDLYDDMTPLDAALECLDRIFANLPQSLAFLKAERRRAVGFYSGVSVFRNYERRDWPEIRRAARSAVLHSPSWCLNRGFWSISLQAWRAPRAAG